MANRRNAKANSSQWERISYENWEKQYRPMKNPFYSEAPFGGCMFEIYGADMEFVRQQPRRKIWTLMDDGDRDQFICEGLHFIDRSGYFITEIPYPSNRFFVIRAD